MVDGDRAAGRAGIMARGVGYGSLGGMGTGALLTTVSGLIEQDIGAGLRLAAIAAVVGAVVGSVVGMFGGVVFALAAPCLVRHRVLTIAAGLSMPAGFLAVIYSALALGHLVSGTLIFASASAPAQWARATLVIWAFTAPAGGLVAHRVLYGRRTSSAETAE